MNGDGGWVALGRPRLLSPFFVFLSQKPYKPRGDITALGSVMMSSLEGEPTQMATITGIVKQLKKERDRVERQLSGLNAALSAFAKVYTGKGKPTRKRRKLSAKARAKIAAAQRARWAKVRANKAA